ncbi:hypothetical protein Tco_0154092 [Tanacetum coccineum]
MVKKYDNSWRMCVDFKDLNKACLKDDYPLPEIDWKVESLCGFPFKCSGLAAYRRRSLNTNGKKKMRKKSFHYEPRDILLYKDVQRGVCKAMGGAGGWVGGGAEGVGGAGGGIGGGRGGCPFGMRMPSHLPAYGGIKHSINSIRTETSKLYARYVIKSATEEEISEMYKLALKGPEIMSTNVERCFKPSIPKVHKGCAKHEEKRFPLDYGSGRSVQANEATHCRTSHVSRTNGKRGAYRFILSGDNKRTGPEVNYTSMEKLVLALVHASKRLKRPTVFSQRADIARLSRLNDDQKRNSDNSKR